MSKTKSSITSVLVLFILSWVSVCRGNGTEKSSESIVEEIKKIVRSEGKYAELDASNQRFFAGRRIVMLERMKSPEGVAGLIEIILDPGFIEFDRKFARDENGDRLPMRVNDPLIGPMVKACWRLYTQPLLDEAAIPSADLARIFHEGSSFGVLGD